MSDLDCRACGACCIGDDGSDLGFAYVDAKDRARMSPRVRLALVGDSTPAVLTSNYGSCCAYLRGTPGERVSCRIYATRPQVCRAFVLGSRRCVAARKEFGLA